MKKETLKQAEKKFERTAKDEKQDRAGARKIMQRDNAKAKKGRK